MKSAQKQHHSRAPGRPGGTLRRLSIVVLAVAATVISVAAADAAPTVITDTGTFTGVPSPSLAGVDVFFGIRYAAAPVGALRWAPPQPPSSPAGTTVAAIPGPACPQAGSIAPLPQ